MVATFPTKQEIREAAPAGLPRILPSLTGLRFFAAALVVIYHMTNHLGAVPVISDLARFGRTGVTFFFVLSGFVLTWTYIGKDTSLGVFYWRRFVRIWPLHIAATVLTASVYIWTDNRIANELSLANLWPAFFLIHTWFPEPAVYRGGSGASWSLADEMFFYAIFPFLLATWAPVRDTRKLLLLPFIMTGISLVLWLTIPVEGIGPYLRTMLLDYFPLSRVVQFMSGVAIAVAIRHGWRCRIPVSAAVLVVLLYHAALIPWSMTFGRTDKWYPYSASQLFALLPFALLIAAVAAHDLQERLSFLARPSFVLLGQASFAWYLLHGPGILVYMHIAGDPATLPSTIVSWVIVAILTQIVSIGAFLWFERPLERRLRRLVPWRGRPAPQDAQYVGRS